MKQHARVDQVRADLVRKIGTHCSSEGKLETQIPGFWLYRRSEPTACTSAAYKPSLIVFAQGKKRINLGRSTLICDERNFLLTSIDLPVVSQVIDASPERPI